MNPDVELFEDSIQRTFPILSDPDASIWGGVTLNADRQVDGKSALKEPRLISVWSWALFFDRLLEKIFGTRLGGYAELANLAAPPTQVDSISGSFFLIDYALLMRLEGFDEQFFMYCEEVDLCRRARQLGARPTVDPSIQIVHRLSETLNSASKIKFSLCIKSPISKETLV